MTKKVLPKRRSRATKQERGGDTKPFATARLGRLCFSGRVAVHSVMRTRRVKRRQRQRQRERSTHTSICIDRRRSHHTKNSLCALPLVQLNLYKASSHAPLFYRASFFLLLFVGACMCRTLWTSRWTREEREKQRKEKKNTRTRVQAHTHTHINKSSYRNGYSK